MPFNSRFPFHIHPDSFASSLLPSLSLSLLFPLQMLLLFWFSVFVFGRFCCFIFYSMFFYGSLANISASLLLPQSDVSCPSTSIVCRRLRAYFNQLLLLLFSLNLPIPTSIVVFLSSAINDYIILCRPSLLSSSLCSSLHALIHKWCVTWEHDTCMYVCLCPLIEFYCWFSKILIYNPSQASSDSTLAFSWIRNGQK